MTSPATTVEATPTQHASPGAPMSDGTTDAATPINPASRPTPMLAADRDHRRRDAHSRPVASAADFFQQFGFWPSDAEADMAGIPRMDGETNRPTTPIDVASRRPPSPSGTIRDATPIRDPSRSAPLSAGSDHLPSDAQISAVAPADNILLLFADSLDDLERARIAAENRARSFAMEGGWLDKGGKLEDIQPETIEGEAGELLYGFLELAKALQTLEHGEELRLKRALRKHPLGPWVKRTKGIGEKQGARLLAAIGDPLWNSVEERPRRGPAELWAYCGLHVVPAGDHIPDDDQIGLVPGRAAKRTRGQKANWNATAKMRAYLVAESCMKSTGPPYRAVYEEGRERYASAVHETPCVQCGSKGKPADVGTDLRDGHKHARALRLVAKRVLRDLFREAKAVAG